MKKNYINLTNGIKWINHLSKVDGFVRIQSTWCEQKLWWRIIQDLGYNFLIDVATGNDVTVFDASAKKKSSRAIFQNIY